MTTEFIREDRYIVIKLKDLSHGQFDALERCFRSRAISTVEGPLVVEQDWPEFEPTWKAIEARVQFVRPTLAEAEQLLIDQAVRSI